MSDHASLAPGKSAREAALQGLLSQAILVGGIFSMGFEECLVITNDFWKKQAGGIPQHCFLLATALAPDTESDDEDEEIILLRVLGPAPLPAEEELLRVRAEAMRELVTAGNGQDGGTTGALDVLTRNEIQFCALKARVLGTFYETPAGVTGLLAFGSDVETL